MQQSLNLDTVAHTPVFSTAIMLSRQWCILNA